MHVALWLVSLGKPALVSKFVLRRLTGMQLLRTEDWSLEGLGVADAADRAYVLERKMPLVLQHMADLDRRVSGLKREVRESQNKIAVLETTVKTLGEKNEMLQSCNDELGEEVALLRAHGDRIHGILPSARGSIPY